MNTRLDESTIDLAVLSTGVATATEAIRWASSTLADRLCVLSSMQDALLIHLVMQVDDSIPIVFLDTGYHFAETHDTVRRVERTYGIEVEVVGPHRPPRSDVAPGECCDDKVVLLEAALDGRDGWISGISRGQTESRRSADLIGLDRRGKVKINPLAQWSQEDRDRYVAHHDLVVHPLIGAGYPSIGCEPCTTRPDGSDDLRSGRWAGTTRTECGLHL